MGSWFHFIGLLSVQLFVSESLEERSWEDVMPDLGGASWEDVMPDLGGDVLGRHNARLGGDVLGRRNARLGGGGRLGKT